MFFSAPLRFILSLSEIPSYVHICPGYKENKATAAAVISLLRISNNGELKEIRGLCSNITPLDIEQGFKVKSQQLEKSLRP